MTTTDQFTILIRDLASALIEHPEALRVAAQPASDGACYFAMKGAQEDEPRLVGTDGTHVDAMTLLVESFGRADGREFTFRLITEGRPQSRPKLPPRDVLEHDPRPARDLLCRILEALDLAEFAVEVGPGAGPRDSLTFAFTVRVKDVVDYRTLTYPLQNVSQENATLIAAVGTLFRAIAKKNGVRYKISVLEP